MVSVEPAEDADLVRLSPYTVVLPSKFVGTVDAPEVPYLVELTLTFDSQRVVCDQVTCRRREDGMAVTSEGMTRVRVAELVHLVAGQAVLDVSTFARPGRAAVEVLQDVDIPPTPHGRSGPDAGHLRALGVIYTVAHACGGSPRRAVMEKLALSRTTANRWIRLAREQGYLMVGGTAEGGDDGGEHREAP